MADPIEKAFDKAIEGVKRRDLAPLGNLGALLATMGIATDDGTLILSGFSFAACSGVLSSLKAFETMNPPGLKEMLDGAFEETQKGLKRLKPQLTSDEPDPSEVLEGLGLITRVTFELNQKMTELAAMLPMGGGAAME